MPGHQDAAAEGAHSAQPADGVAAPEPQTPAPEPQMHAADSAPDGPVGDVHRALAQLDELPLSEHPEVYQRVHADLQGALADIDDA